MSISAEEKVCYLREAAIVLAKEGFQLDEVHTDRLCILLDGSPLCEVTKSGGVAYRNEDIDEPERIAAKDKVYEIVRTTAEYMRQMEMAPFLKADGLEDGYKVLADFNGTVLAGVQSKHGVHFVTWDWAYGHTGVCHGQDVYKRQEYVYGPDVERDFNSPLYDSVLEESLYRLNKGLPADAINDALFKLRNFENGELVQKNAEFMEYLQSGIPVRYLEKGEERSGIVYLADYSHPENNSFIVANQWTFIENSNKRPDVILFLNGLPIVLVELKSPSREETDASEAYRQLRNYMQEIPSMFIYNAICVMSDQSTSKAGTLSLIHI